MKLIGLAKLIIKFQINKIGRINQIESNKSKINKIKNNQIK